MAVNFICVNWQNFCGLGSEYVNILYDSVRRNLPDDFEGKFICLTDNPEGLTEGIITKELPKDVNGWWNKLYIFAQGILPDNELNIFLDLDTVITGALDDIVTYRGKFAMLSDFYHPNIGAGGVMMWKGNYSYLWENWLLAEKPEFYGNGELGFGEAGWIQKFITPDRLQTIFPKQIVSYKVHAQDHIPERAKIVCFHGTPRPHDAWGWVRDFWKIGGSTTFHSKVVGNTEGKKLFDNIQHSLGLKLPKLKNIEPHNGHAVIIGGAPSLKDNIHEIRERYNRGQILFATNNTFQYLLDNKIIPHYHIMLDARDEMADMVPKIISQIDLENGREYPICLYSSQCSPLVFEAAKDNDKQVTLWHHFADDIRNLLPKDCKDEPLVGMGTSVGLKAIALAHILGFRQIHIYGMDSSYENDEHHAYKQPLNDKERIIEVTMNGKQYKTAPWMCTQKEEFEAALPHLIKDTVVTMHCKGLLQDLSVMLANPLANYVESDYDNHQPKRISYA